MESRITVRALRAADLERIVQMDAQNTGRNRALWFEGKLKRALQDADVRVSLGAESDGRLVGALLGSVQYGEFGLPEPVAVLDTVLVDKNFRGHGVGRAMMLQMLRNFQGLRIERVRTEVGDKQGELLGFFRSLGFAPSPRLVLELTAEGAQSALRLDERAHEREEAP